MNRNKMPVFGHHKGRITSNRTEFKLWSSHLGLVAAPAIMAEQTWGAASPVSGQN